MKRILPPTLLLICVLLMLLLRWLWPVQNVIPFPFNFLGIALIFLGIGMAVREDGKFAKVGTTINTFGEPEKLVTDGLFKYSRNPMYLGFALALLGVWLLLGALSPLLGVVIFVVITDRWYMPFEERMLAEKFGPEFEAYKSKTRGWI